MLQLDSAGVTCIEAQGDQDGSTCGQLFPLLLMASRSQGSLEHPLAVWKPHGEGPAVFIWLGPLATVQHPALWVWVKAKPPGDRRFSLCFHLPRFHFGPLF